MKVAIAGAGNVGQFIANDLALAGHEVLILEQDPGVVSRSAAALSGPRGDGGSIEWRTADACEVTSLREAEIGSVDVVVAATGDDEDNLVISLLAKQEFAVPRVVARVNHPKNEWLFNENWGVDVSVSTPAPDPGPDRGGPLRRKPGAPLLAGEGPGPAGGGHAGPEFARHRAGDPGARGPPRLHVRRHRAGGARRGAPGATPSSRPATR